MTSQIPTHTARFAMTYEVGEWDVYFPDSDGHNMEIHTRT